MNINLLFTLIVVFNVVEIAGLGFIIYQKSKQIKKLQKENKQIEQRFNKYLTHLDEELSTLRKKLFKKLHIRMEPKKTPHWDN